MTKQSSIDFAPIQFNESLLDFCVYVDYILRVWFTGLSDDGENSWLFAIDTDDDR